MRASSAGTSDSRAKRSGQVFAAEVGGVELDMGVLCLTPQGSATARKRASENFSLARQIPRLREKAAQPSTINHQLSPDWLHRLAERNPPRVFLRNARSWLFP